MSVCAVTDNSDITSLGKCELYPLKWEYETFVVCYLYNIWVRGFCNGRSFKGFFIDSKILDNLERNYVEIDKQFKIF